MAESGGSKTSLLDNDSQRRSSEERADVAKKQELEFEECAGIGKAIIARIKASLLASANSFNKSKYVRPLENPYNKAYHYLEENQVLAMLEDLITYTVFRQPEEPFPFMTDVVEKYYGIVNKTDSSEG